MNEPAPLIVALGLSGPALAMFDELRRQHFPPERNHLSAHCTLFHHLPGAAEDEVRLALAAEAGAMAAPTVEVMPPRFTGRGVAFGLASASLTALRDRIARLFAGRLTAQDSQGWRPHVTVQNKVAPGDARALHAALAASFAPFSFEATGLELWRYRGGPWQAVASMPFASSILQGAA